LNLNNRITLFVKLGRFFSDYINNNLESLEKNKFDKAINESILHNSFFSKKNILKSLLSWSNVLTKKSIDDFLSNYLIKNKKREKKIAIIMAGNIPLVGFHDFFCVIISGNFAVIKLSSKDSHLFKFILSFLVKENPDFDTKFDVFESKLEIFDAVIATGNNISANQFELYFKKYPKIIRRNRHSIAILNGNETKKEIELLANDIFYYYGLGCRNVSKIFIPNNYNLDILFKSFVLWNEVINKNSYANNYNYYRAIYLLNKEVFFDNGFVLLKESEKIGSPVGTIYFEYYKSDNQIKEMIKKNNEKIQCIVSNNNYPKTIKFGETQMPNLNDFADDIDTFNFLLKLN
tara:strand:+ start:2253 stop:3293 length:1041 start_codon:yes stop_codon:yes gene_type:complete